MATYLWKGFTSSPLDSSSSLGIIGDQLAFVELVVALLPATAAPNFQIFLLRYPSTLAAL